MTQCFRSPTRFEPHYREITRADQVQIFEPILKDSEGQVTTGLLNAVGYLKDNRILPAGFDKTSADNDVQVVGEAAEDPRTKIDPEKIGALIGPGGKVIRAIQEETGAVIEVSDDGTRAHV